MCIFISQRKVKFPQIATTTQKTTTPANTHIAPNIQAAENSLTLNDSEAKLLQHKQ